MYEFGKIFALSASTSECFKIIKTFEDMILPKPKDLRTSLASRFKESSAIRFLLRSRLKERYTI